MDRSHEHRVVAVNPAAASENRIHADDVARRYGFEGGLVPGVTVFGSLCPTVVATPGEEWLDRGLATVGFVAVDVRWAVGTEIVAWARHTAIWQLAPPATTGG